MSKRLALAVPVIAALGLAQAAAGDADTLAAADLEWREVFPGVAFAPAYGDWESEAHGKFVRFAEGTAAPLHTHTGAYHAVMISGELVNIYEDGARAEISPGDYFHMAAERPHGHECVSQSPCFFYTHSDALWDIALSDE